MAIFKDHLETVKVKDIYCNTCKRALVLKTITVYRPSKKDPGITFEYMCPECKESNITDREYPRVVSEIKSQ